MPSVSYATVADAQLIYGAANVAVVCDRDLDGTIDTAAFERHIAFASRCMDGYLLGRYPLPLLDPPEHFVKLCVDIAMYFAAQTADVRTDEIRKRYDDAIKYFELVAQNRVKLQLVTDPVATGPNISATPTHDNARTTVHEPCARLFTDCTLKGVL